MCPPGFFPIPTYSTEQVTYYFDEEDDYGWYDVSINYSDYNGGGSICEGCSWDDTNPCAMVDGHYITICDETWGAGAACGFWTL